MQSQLHDNTNAQRFELKFGDETVFANYERKGNILYITHVEAPVSLRGSGAAGIFMEKMVQHVSAHSQKILPVCSYAAAWLKRHPEYASLIAE